MTRDSLDSGYAWSVAALGTVIIFLAKSQNVLFGMIFLDLQKHFDTSTSAVAHINSLRLASFALTGAIHGRLVGRYGSRPVGIVSSAITIASAILAFMSQTLLQFYLSYGLLLGIGQSAFEIAALTCVFDWFERKKASAVSMVMTGIQLAYLLMPPLIVQLLTIYSWKGSLLIIAGIQLHLFVCCALLRPISKMIIEFNDQEERRSVLLKGDNHFKTIDYGSNGNFIEPEKVNQTTDEDTYQQISVTNSWVSVVLEPSFIFFLFSQFLASMASAMPFHFLVPLSLLVGHTMNYSASLVSVMGLTGLLSRLFIILFGSYIEVKGRTNLTYGSAIMSGFLGLLLFLSTSYWCMIAYSGLVGISTALFGIYSANVIPDIFGKFHLAERFGISQASYYAGYLLAIAMTGFLWDSSGMPSLPFAVSGVLGIIGGLGLCASFSINARSVL